MGPYCKYCDNRCFVQRVLRNGQWTLLATCSAGMEHDRRATGGEDHTTARNPLAPQPDPDAVMVMDVLLASPNRDEPGMLLSAAKAYEALKSSRERAAESTKDGTE